MKAEIISVGSQLLTGKQLNTNTQLISEELRAVGIEVSLQTSVRDSKKDLKSILAAALGRSNIVILTGGLGFKSDDITRDAVCELLDIEQKTDEQAYDKIKAYFFRKGEQAREEYFRQAQIPAGSVAIKNEIGLAVGSILKSGNQCIIMLPGNPNELRVMLERSVIPFLKEMTGKTVVSKTINVFGMTESIILSSLSDIMDGISPIVSTFEIDGKTDILVSSCDTDFKTAIKEVDKTVEEIERRLGDSVYGIDEPSLHHAVVSELLENKLTVATAESCTGGLVSKKITDISGASLCFEFGVTSYSDGIKNLILGVGEDTLTEFGAVSAETALQMAVGAMNTANSDFGISVTGYAGPASMLGEPIGLVFISVCNKETAWVKRFDLAPTGKETREQIRELASLNAFDMLRRVMNGFAIFNAQRLPVSEVPNSIESREAGRGKLIFSSSAKKSDLEPIKVSQGEKKSLPKKKNFFKSIFPNKEDKASEKVRKCTFLAALLLFVISVSYILSFFIGIKQNENMYNNLAELKTETPAASLVYPKGYLEEFGVLYGENKEIAGWIEIDGTPLNYPVVQTTDNDFYLKHNFYKEKERHGTPFIDMRNNSYPLDFNTIIYGHNMKSDNQMFSELENYYKGKNSLNYYRKHPIINFDTVYEKSQWKVFAIFTYNVDSKSSDYFEYCDLLNVKDEDEFSAFMYQVRRRSVLNIPVDVISSDKIVTLSTCYYEYDGQRLVVMARKLRKNEDSSVAVNSATYNTGNTISSNTQSEDDESTNSKLWNSSTTSRYNTIPNRNPSNTASTSSKTSSTSSKPSTSSSASMSSKEESSSSNSTTTSVPTQTETSVPTETETSVPTQPETSVPTQTETSVPTQTE